MNKIKIGKQLKELRRARGWRQLEVADRVGLSRSAISNIESGKRSLTLVTLQRFCELYNIDISYFGIETESFEESVDLIARLEKANKRALWRNLIKEVILDSDFNISLNFL